MTLTPAFVVNLMFQMCDSKGEVNGNCAFYAKTTKAKEKKLHLSLRGQM